MLMSIPIQDEGLAERITIPKINAFFNPVACHAPLQILNHRG